MRVETAIESLNAAIPQLAFTRPNVEQWEFIAKSDHPVFILGETGTGKELTARGIHQNGPRRLAPFVTIDCGALAPSLIESELFGHAKGAFTGANRDRVGLLSLAENGTVFLDEVGELAVELQSRLLHALQEKEVRPVGGTKSVPLRARIIAATNVNIEKALQEGTFRKDLFYRLCVIKLELPPLRERMADFPALVQSLLPHICNCRVPLTVTTEAMGIMALYSWPGNIRELENTLKRAHVFSGCSTIIGLQDLPWEMQMDKVKNQTSDVVFPANKVVPLRDLEKSAIIHALNLCNNNRLTAAKLLGIGKTTLYRKILAYDIAARPLKETPNENKAAA